MNDQKRLEQRHRVESDILRFAASEWARDWANRAELFLDPPIHLGERFALRLPAQADDGGKIICTIDTVVNRLTGEYGMGTNSISLAVVPCTGYNGNLPLQFPVVWKGELTELNRGVRDHIQTRIWSLAEDRRAEIQKRLVEIEQGHQEKLHAKDDGPRYEADGDPEDEHPPCPNEDCGQSMNRHRDHFMCPACGATVAV